MGSVAGESGRVAETPQLAIKRRRGKADNKDVQDLQPYVEQFNQIQRAAFQVAWPAWAFAFLCWAASTALGVYVTIHLVALIKSAKGFLDAKAERLAADARVSQPHSIHERLAFPADSDARYRPRP